MESSKKTNKIQALMIILIISMTIQTGCVDTNIPIDTSGLINEYSKIDENFDAGLKSTIGFTLVEENNEAELYINGKTAEVAVKNKSTDVMWYSNPVDKAGDSIAVGTNMQELSSQVKVEYYDSKIKKAFFNSNNDSISLGQYNYYKIPDGVRVNFGLGYIPVAYTVPRVLSIERMQFIQSKLNDEDKALLESYYAYLSLDFFDSETDKAFYISALPISKTRDIYYLSILSLTDPSLNDKLSDYIMSKVQALLDKAGYTKEDYDFDNNDNMIVVTEVEENYMAMSIEYKLDGADLIAEVPSESIKYDGKLMTVMRISFLPYFGAAGLSKQGYIFVPDGSGALVSLNNGKTNYEAYNKPVYGRDHSIFVLRLNQIEDSQIHMPVFGLKQDDDAFLAIIESGDAVADINLGTSGVINDYNNVYASFNIKNSAQELRSTLNIAGFLNFQKNPLQSNIRIRYTFLKGEQADYTGMALKYQKYLLEHKLIEKQTFGDSLPVAINLIGAVPDTVSVMGIPRKSQKPVTTFEQAQMILEELKLNGIHRVDLMYSNWCNNGIKNTVSDEVNIIKSLGSRKDFAKLIDYANNNDVVVYPDLNFVHATGNALYKLLTEKRQAARDLGNNIIQDYNYNIATLYFIDDGSNTIISPGSYEEIFGKFVEDYAKYKTGGLSLSSLGYNLNADYNKKRPLDRQMAKDIIVDELGNLSKEGLSMSFNGANSYVLQHANMLFSVPTNSSNYYIFDRTVPFYQIVLHGILPYAGEPLNLSGDIEYDALKMIETGTLPSFEWMYVKNTELKDTDANYFALYYRDWIDWAKTYYERIDSALAGCQDSTIISHEMLQEDVFQTHYSNGTLIVVNYRSTSVTVDGTVIGPMDFKVIG